MVSSKQKIRLMNSSIDIYSLNRSRLAPVEYRISREYGGARGSSCPSSTQELMREAGFVDVEIRMIQLPTCVWEAGNKYCLSRLLFNAKRISHFVGQRDKEIGALMTTTCNECSLLLGFIVSQRGLGQPICVPNGQCSFLTNAV
jgi:hypothetical protein